MLGGMSNALRVPHRMTVAEFQDWLPPAGLEDRRWNLVDGEPVCMAPTSVNHGLIQSELGGLIWRPYLAALSGSICVSRDRNAASS